MAFRDPCRLPPNRVKRLYTGGRGIDLLRGAAAPADGHFPEDWIASCVKANSRDVPPDHGLSMCEAGGRQVPFPELLRDHADDILGAAHVARYGANPGFLSKLLDSAMRLPVQVHPDRPSAQRLFGSPFGKTEAWITFATREIAGEQPYILLGFNERLDPAVFRRESEAGVYERGLDMLHRFAVRPGDVFLVHGRMAHAIGPGVTMVEVMEPTDITINPERQVCGWELPPERRFARIACQDALDLFDYTPLTREQVLERCCPRPEVLESRPEGALTRRISRERFPFFEVQELELAGSWPFTLAPRSFRVGVVVSGEVRVGGLALRGGESFFIPWACGDLELEGRAKLVLLLPPPA